MKKNRTIIIALLLIAALALGIGYANLSNIPLNISGSAQFNPSQGDFTVIFEGTPAVEKATASVLADKTKASMDVTALKAVGETATATFTVKNTGKYAAKILSCTATDTENDYLQVTVEDVAGTVLQPNDTKTVTVTVTLVKLPKVAQKATINVDLVAQAEEVA